MKTLTHPRRAMRPGLSGVDDPLPADECAWCQKKIGPTEVCSRGTDMGKDVIVCAKCLTPPQLLEWPTELTVEESESAKPEPAANEKPVTKEKPTTKGAKAKARE